MFRWELYRGRDFETDGYRRHELFWNDRLMYGFGYCNRCWYFPTSQWAKGHGFWLNSYRQAPFRFRILNHCGIVNAGTSWLRWRFRVRSGGSLVDPYVHWTMSFYRVYIGGDIPHWVRWLIHRKRENEWAQEEWDAFQRPDWDTNPMFQSQPEYDDDMKGEVIYISDEPRGPWTTLH